MFFFFFSFTLLISGISSDNVKLTVPYLVKPSQEFDFLCQFDFQENDVDYVKWFQNGQEFLEYSPKENTKIKTFPVNGFEIQKKKTSLHKVSVKNARFDVIGNYTCEVASSSKNYQDSQSIRGFNIPDEDPRLFVSSDRAVIGDVVQIECSVPSSTPKPKITLLLNGKQISSYHPESYGLSGTTSYSVDLVVYSGTFVNGFAEIECVVEIKDFYRGDSVVTLIESSRRLFSMSSASSAAATAFLIPLLLVKLFWL